MKVDKNAYNKEWYKKHPERRRMYKLKWYYRNRIVINLMFAKAKGMELDAADKWYAEKFPEG